MIWEILSLFVLWKMLKLEATLWGKDALERKNGVWLDEIWLEPQKNQKIRVFIHTVDRWGMWLMNSFNHLSRSQK